MFDALTSPALGAVYALASAFAWALTSFLVRRYAAFCSMVTINAVRISVSGVALLFISVLGSARAEVATMTLATFALVAGSTILAAGIGDSIFFECTRILGLGRAMTLAMTYPLMAAAFAVVFLGEIVTVRAMLGAIVTLAGLVLIVGPRDRSAPAHPRLWLGVAGSFVVALTWALSAILMKPAMRDLTPLTAQGLRLPIVAIFLWLTPWARAGLPALRTTGRRAAAPLLMLSALTAVSSMTWIAGLKYSDVVVATVLSSTSPMFALALGAAFLGERLTAAAVVGALLTVAGIVVLQV